VVCETTPLTQSIRNAEREHPVPAPAIERMIARWDPPDLTEVESVTTVASGGATA